MELSSAEHLLWQQQFTPTAPPFIECYRHIWTVLRIQDGVRIDALAHGLDDLAARHAVLRTTFPRREGLPGRVIASSSGSPLCRQDPDRLPAGEREAETARLAQAVAAPFNLTEAPGWRACLLELSAGECLLVIVVHHIVFDVWSKQIVLSDLDVLYRARVRGVVADLPALRPSYTDYVEKEWAQLQAGAFEPATTFWLNHLDGACDVRLPIADATTDPVSAASAKHRFLIGCDHVRALRELGHQMHATLAVTLFAAFAAFLHRLTQSSDIVIGMPVSDRFLARDYQGVVGLFMNVLPIRMQLRRRDSFADAIAHARRQSDAANVHRQVPYGHLLTALNAGAGTFPYRFVFNLVNLPRTHATWPGGRLEATSAESEQPSFADLSLHAVEDGDGLHGALLYKSDLLSPSDVAVIADDFAAFVAEIVRRPDTPLTHVGRTAASTS